MTTTTTTAFHQYVTCQCCDRTATVEHARENWHRLSLRDRGNAVAYVCDCHGHNTDDECIENYTTENDKFKGKPSKKDETYSFEWENHDVTLAAKCELSHADMMPSRDCTTDIEYKSPIYLSANSLVATVKKTLSYLVETGKVTLTVDDGTHFNVGTKSRAMAQVTDYFWHNTDAYIKVFAPITKAMQDDPEGTIALFGRYFNRWALEIDVNTYHAGMHENWVNVQHDTHLEFRICKFVSGEQYHLAMQTCMKIKRSVMNQVYENMVDGYVPENKLNNCGRQLVRYFKESAKLAKQL